MVLNTWKITIGAIPRASLGVLISVRTLAAKIVPLIVFLVISATLYASMLRPEERLFQEPSPTQFEFHSGFWINLHHFLYREAAVEGPQTGSHMLTLNINDGTELNLLAADERATWNAAVAAYSNTWIHGDLLFGKGMGAIKNELEDAEASADLSEAQIPSELKGVLVMVAPIYRKHWWEKHNSQNRQWILQLQPLLENHGAELSKSLAKIYETPWPHQPIRVDVVNYANWSGAYTTLEPTRPTISSTEPANSGEAALEILFHESSHGMVDKLMKALTADEKVANPRAASEQVQLRRDLWHEVLFYTAGELVAERIPGYVPYADKSGLWKRAWPGPDRALIEQDWKPHMDGRAGLQEAVAKLVEDLALAQKPQ